MSGPAVRAAVVPSRGAAVFSHGSFGPTGEHSLPAEALSRCPRAAAVDPLRPSAEGARPTEPRPLTPLVAPRRGRRGLLLVPAAPRPVLRRASRHHRFARTALSRAGLGRVTETTQGAFHRFGPRPRGHGGGLHANVSDRVPPSGTDSRAAMGLAAVRRREAPPHATPQDRVRLATPALRERGGCSSPTSATNPTSRAPAVTARFPVRPPLAQLPRPPGRTPTNMPSRVALDGAPRASIDSAHAPADPAVTGAPDFLVGSDIGEPSKGRPPFRGVVFHGRRVRIDL
jgi:hypothetical protein